MQEAPESWTGRLAVFLKGAKGKSVLLIVGLAGILLIGLSEWWPSGDKEVSAPTAEQQTDAYVQALETQLKEIVGSIQGAGQCKVMVTLESGVQYVYAQEEKSNSDRQEGDSRVSQSDGSQQSIVIVDTEDGRQGLLVTEIQPTVKGVVVVCEGGDLETVQQRIVQAVTTALNITSKRVCVTKLSA